MKKNKKPVGLETKRRRYGYIFVTHWALGLILFFAYPLFSSIIYAFNDVTIGSGTIDKEFVGLVYFKKILIEDPNYLDNLRDSVVQLLYSLPIIIALSLVLAVLLNKKFRGRAIFRSIFFLPVLISSSAVIRILTDSPIYMNLTSGEGMIDYESIITNLDVPSMITPFLTFMLSSVMSLVWNCGVQIILFLAGLQSIPDSLYEVSKIEGANKWEEFWMITIPCLRNIISLVIVFTMIELFTSSENVVVTNAYSLMVSQKFGESSAMLWFYFVIVISVIGTVFVLFNRFSKKKWE
ncbi:MAG: sugar ABC transporter permease [Clostridia bacterium]|nr:sugar ABC transporter permease [Clostridia bacterium]